MVSFLGFLKQSQIFVEHLFLGEGDAVHAHQLLALLVAAPVCTRQAHHLGCLDGGGGGDMGSAAQVCERALRVGGDVAVLKFGNQLAFVDFAAVAEEFQGVGFADVGAHDLLFFLGQFEHFFLDGGKIGRGDAVAVGVDVVVETVFNGGAYAEFHSGKEFLQGLGQQVGRAVPERMLSFVVFPFEEFDPGVAVDRTGEIPFGIVNRCGQHVLCQPGADAFSYL